jgi:hypothetical protein
MHADVLLLLLLLLLFCRRRYTVNTSCVNHDVDDGIASFDIGCKSQEIAETLQLQSKQLKVDWYI